MDDFHDMVKTIDEEAEGLDLWERRFIADMIDNPPESPSPKVQEIVLGLYERYC